MKTDLTKQRYEVIAEYPDSPFKVGTILTKYNGQYREIKYDTTYISNPEQYPSIFRKMDWWEKRDPKCMPDYLKGDNEMFNTKTSQVVKVVKHESECDFCKALDDDGKERMLPYKYTLPATETEYNEYRKILNK